MSCSTGRRYLVFLDDITLRQLTLGHGGIDVHLDCAGAQVAVQFSAPRSIRAVTTS